MSIGVHKGMLPDGTCCQNVNTRGWPSKAVSDEEQNSLSTSQLINVDEPTYTMKFMLTVRLLFVNVN